MHASVLAPFLLQVVPFLQHSPVIVTSFTTSSIFSKKYNSRKRSTLIPSSSTSYSKETEQEESASATVITKPLKKSKSDFSNFNYLNQWYPVIWNRDLEVNKLEKITLFDVDYVITKTTTNNNIVLYTLLDKCPHRCAALSEGRCTTSGYIQCAYHGWSFDKEGSCVEIPQSDATKYSSRTNVASIPTRVHQEMIWIYPGESTADDSSTTRILPEIPSVPELNNDTYKIVTSVVRDFPLDWTILIENILDPDHGLFAHQDSFAFDLYSANSKHPQIIKEEFHENDDNYWKISANVTAVPKLAIPNLKKKADDTKAGIITYQAPSLIYWARRDKYTNETKFLNCFWVTPVGTGKSRFMSASVSNIKLPINIPRWFAHMNILNFLDQDTFLLLSSQKYILEAERRGSEGENRKRKALFQYNSPTERFLSRVGSFWDSTLEQVPNRNTTLQRMDLSATLSREYALDRYEQHTKICPDTQGFIRKSKIIQKGALLSSISSMIALLLMPNSTIRKRSCVLLMGISSAMLYLMMGKLVNEFYFKYTSDHRDRDLRKIPSVWVDKE